jgi:hypothetical protein
MDDKRRAMIVKLSLVNGPTSCVRAQLHGQVRQMIGICDENEAGFIIYTLL